MPRPRFETDTIAAVSTAPGKSGISIVKISGPDSIPLVKKIFSAKKDPEFPERTMVYGYIVENNEKIDEVLVCVMKSPYSYTGENVVEIQSHGGFAAAETILGILLAHGARLAEPGEFTKRAFLNGKIDLAQAEAVMEIVSADNREHLKNAEQLLEGSFSKKIKQLLSDLRKSESLLEFNIDFQDHGIEAVRKNDIKKSIKKIIKTLDAMIASYKTAKRIKYGLNVVIAGKVNSGKSSLFNTLLGKERAIVNRKPGTTRDWLEEKIEFDGISINLIDTAGLRSSDDEIEREGVRKTEKLVQRADIVVYLHEAQKANLFQIDNLDDKPDYIHILSKSDLAKSTKKYDELLAVSSKTHAGITGLQSEIAKKSTSLIRTSNSNSLVMVERHRIALTEARKNLNVALSNVDTWSEEIISFELQEAKHNLEVVLGREIDLDVLNEIFNNFCVGK